MKREELKIKNSGTKEFPYYLVMIGKKEFCATNSEDNAKVVVKYLLSHLSQLIEKSDPLPPDEGAEPNFRIVLDEIERWIERQATVTDSELRALWNQLSDAITLSEQQPTAEGAEEMLQKYVSGIVIFERHHAPEVTRLREKIIEAMNEFATLHAQKIADKMVSERLRAELINFWMYLSVFDKHPDTAKRFVDEYLKSREK